MKIAVPSNDGQARAPDENSATHRTLLPKFLCCESSDTAVDPVAPESSLAPKEREVKRSTIKKTLGALLSIAVALFPKCPICGMTYLSLSGIAAMPLLPAFYWLFPLLTLLMFANLVSLWVLARQRQRYAAFGLALAGTALLLGGGDAFSISFAPELGVALMAMGALVSLAEMGKFPARFGEIRYRRHRFVPSTKE